MGAVVVVCFKVKRAVVVESDNGGDCVRGHDWWCDGYGLSGEAVIIGAEQSIGEYKYYVNGKNAYELKGKFLDDLLSNAFSGTNREDASDDQEGVVDEGFSDVEEANNDDEQETVEIFRIETNLFDYETLLCTKFKEFNFLVKVDPELFTHDVERTRLMKRKLNDPLAIQMKMDYITMRMLPGNGQLVTGIFSRL
ncbi:hypothetical protein Tco_0514433 [Tanacetum coccineum]